MVSASAAKRARATKKPEDEQPEKVEQPENASPAAEEQEEPEVPQEDTFAEELQKKLNADEVPAKASHFPTPPTPNL